MKSFMFLVFVAILNLSISDPISKLNEQCEGIVYEAFPHPEDSHMFIGCIQGEASVFQCPNGEFFDEISVTCTKESKKDENERLKKACRGHKNNFVAHPDSCSEYLYCDEKEKSHVTECDADHIFNPANVRCSPGNANTCEFKSDISTFDEDNDCSEDDSENCEDLPTEEPDTCEDDDDDEGSCEDFITNPPPTEEPPTEEPVDSTTESTSRPPNVDIRFTCPLSGNARIPHPRDCTRYSECIDGQAFVQQCDPGLHFDVITSSCRDPDDGFCAIYIQCS